MDAISFFDFFIHWFGLAERSVNGSGAFLRAGRRLCYNGEVRKHLKARNDADNGFVSEMDSGVGNLAAA